MRKGLLGTLALLAAANAVSAYAADIPVAPIYKAPPPAVFSWTGLYLGADVGMRSAIVDPSVNSTTLNGLNILVPPFCASPGLFGIQPGPCPPAGVSLQNTSFRVGPYLGYNWQLGSQWVVGFEEDWGWADGRNSLNGAFYPGGHLGFISGAPDSSFSVKTTWDGSIRGRVGFLATPGVLVYATGGATWMRVEATSACPTGVGQACSPGGAIPIAITNSATRLGWTIGGGLEAHLLGNWLARGEYRYADYGTWGNTDLRTFVGAQAALVVGYAVRLQTHTAMFGLAYKLGN
jgi:outer membrane immunogenic protein